MASLQSTLLVALGLGSVLFVFGILIMSLGAPHADVVAIRTAPLDVAPHAALQTISPSLPHMAASPPSQFPQCALPPRPPAYSTLCELLDSWQPHETRPPPGLDNGSALFRFNFTVAEELEAARAYRRAELPFVLHSVPDLDAAHATWTDAYLREQFARTPRNMYKIERSNAGAHFLYYSLRGARPPVGFRPPQSPEELSFDEFLREAWLAEEEPPHRAGDSGLLYLTVSAGAGAQIDWIRSGLKFLLPSDEARAPGRGLVGHELFDVDRTVSFHGINCRLGMRGIMQAAHYDSKRNFIAMVSGHKRYVIQPPSACEALELLHPGDPSTRHASFDWDSAHERSLRRNKAFCNSPATQIVLGPADLLYLPSYWFHYIVSLDKSVQCNMRSGRGHEGEGFIKKCGFL